MPASLVPDNVIIIGIVVILLAIGLFAWIAIQARKVNLTRPSDEKPEWMRNTPPEETIAATKADGEGIQVFDLDPGEELASPFAEQIEDILQAKLDADPELKKYKVDLGTAPDGRLEISINGEKYSGIDAIPDEKLKKLFHEAIAKWKES